MSHNPQTHTTNTQCVRVCRHVLVLVVCILSSCRSAWTARCLLLYASCLLLFCFDCRGEDIACVCCCASAWEQPRGEPVLSFFFFAHGTEFHFIFFCLPAQKKPNRSMNLAVSPRWCLHHTTPFSPTPFPPLPVREIFTFSTLSDMITLTTFNPSSLSLSHLQTPL